MGGGRWKESETRRQRQRERDGDEKALSTSTKEQKKITLSTSSCPSLSPNTRQNSLYLRLHPAYVSGEIEVDGAKRELTVQEAYTPDSQCFGCGPAAPDGLGLRSFRDAGGLVARSTIDHKYQAFPGIVNGGIVSALFDCHGNWTAAVALMDRSCLPRPPLTLTAELLVNFREPTPPGVPLIVRSTVARVRESASAGSGKASVQVDLTLHALSESGSGSGGAEGSSDSGISSSSSGGGGGGKEKETLLATATGIFKKLGALRAL